MIEAGRPRAGTRLTTKCDRFAYRARVGVSRVFREPLRRRVLVSFQLPALRSAGDAAGAMASITAAVAAGDITPGEAAELSRLVEAYVKAIEASEFDERLRAIEERSGARRA